MKMTLLIIGVSLCIMFLGNFSISFHPFSISLPYWHRPLGLFLMLLALGVYNVGERTSGYRDGLKDGAKITFEEFKQKVDSLNSIVK